ncbi:MAG: cytochrome-c peroxidase [Deltaproteobacteria bacterium]|nr:cytochrome-c peroxidase [Deltaproteobacteria bacterium]
MTRVSLRSLATRNGLLLTTALTLAAAAGCDDRPFQELEQRKAAAAKAAAAAKVSSDAAKAAPKETLAADELKVFAALPKEFSSSENPANDAKIALGRMLYHDPRLSLAQDISCNSCHDITRYGVDGEKTSPGHKGQRGDRNSPTVYNAGGHVAQFWDGRAENVEAQAKGPILNPGEMAMPDEKAVLAVVDSIPEYVKLFKDAFPSDKKPVSYGNLANAIGAFERRLVTPSRWDKFLEGDKSALSDQEKEGLALFVRTGCPGCHSGPAVGGGSFQKLGLIKPYPDQSDLGRFKVTKSEADKMVFRVPSLRNVEKTGPYFHNGSIATLEEAVKLMAHHQLGKDLTAPEVGLIVTFLKTLTGDLPLDYAKAPELPKSTDKTPKPKT